MYRKGGVLYYTICAHVPETQKCVTFVTFVTLVTLRFCSLLRATSLLVRSLSSLLRIAAVNFLRNVTIFSGKVANKKQCEV